MRGVTADDCGSGSLGESDAVATIASFLVGAALDHWGWDVVNLIAAPLLLAALAIVQWYALTDRKSRVAD